MAGDKDKRPFHKEVLKDMQYKRYRRRQALQGKSPMSREKFKERKKIETIPEKQKRMKKDRG